MSRISDVSGRLGQYMLAGWVLTDQGCNTCSVPMLRSPSGHSPEQLFCAQCQTSPEAISTAGRVVAHHGVPPPSTASTSSTGFSGVSTPLTEVSNSLSSPTFALPPDSQETIRRRAQSDRASAEIGRRMLRGWALLAEECPNDLCYGVPLVRPPKAGGSKDPRKECVVCGNVYTSEKDSQGMESLVRLNSADTPSTLQPNETRISHPERQSAPDISVASSLLAPFNVNNTVQTVSSNTFEPAHPQPPSEGLFTSSAPTLDASVTSLDRTLMVLACKLATLLGREPVDHVTIGDVASSMEKVTNALRVVKQLRSQEISLYAS